MRRNLAVIALCIFTAPLFLMLFVTNDRSAKLWKAQIGYPQSIEAAKRLGADLGYNLSQWNFAVTAKESTPLILARRERKDSDLLKMFTPMTVRVVGRPPNERGSFEAEFTSDGRPLSFSVRPIRSSQAMKETNSGALAERELKRYAGEHFKEFHPATLNARGSDGDRSLWEWREEGSMLIARFEVVVNQGSIRREALTFEVAPSLIEKTQQRIEVNHNISSSIFTIFLWVGLVLLCWSFFQRMGVRKDQVRFAIFPTLLVVGFMLVGMLGVFKNDARLRAYELNVPTFSNSAQMAFGVLSLSLLFYLLLAAGYSLVQPTQRPRWIGMRLLSRAELTARPLGREVALGILFGWVLGAVVYLPGILVPGRPWAEPYPPKILVDPVPAFSGYGPDDVWDLLGFAAFLLPLMRMNLKTSRWLYRGSVLVVGTALFAGSRPAYPDSLTATLITAFLTAGATLWLYRRSGVVAVWCSAYSVSSLIASASFLFSKSPALHRESPYALMVPAALLLWGTLAWTFGKKVDEHAVMNSMEPEFAQTPQSDRERLLGEFSFARRAQQGMLPAATPLVDGFSISAICEPAREVGGDLYDFIPFSGGRWGLCVADVSGKGVPAALYMTMTKGMLASVRGHEPELEQIASRMNRHIYTTGARKTFVTMALGLLNPTERSFSYVRAGHNPVLLYRAAARKTEFLEPRGMGLGITSQTIFDRQLEPMSVSLEPGDILVLYSDGLTEMMNSQREQFGEDRLCEVVLENAHLNALGIQYAIVDHVRQFRGEAEPHDDLTIVVVRAESVPALRVA